MSVKVSHRRSQGCAGLRVRLNRCLRLQQRRESVKDFLFFAVTQFVAQGFNPGACLQRAFAMEAGERWPTDAVDHLQSHGPHFPQETGSKKSC